eukprot:gene18261-biopygen18468
MWYIQLPPYVLMWFSELTVGQPMVCRTKPSLCFDASISHTSFTPRPYVCGSASARKSYFSKSTFEIDPRHPSARIVCFARRIIPGWYTSFFSPVFETPLSSVITPVTLPSASYSGWAAAKPGKTSTPSSSACSAIHAQTAPSDTK